MTFSLKWLHKFNLSNSFRVSEINPRFRQLEPFINQLPDSFYSLGQIIHKARNEIRMVETKQGKIMIKYFGKIYLANRFVYAWIRPSKAKRSYENALLLQEKGIDTPCPLAYIECYKKGMLHENLFLYLHHSAPQDIRKLLAEPDYPDRKEILRAFARFSFFLYQQGVYHRDYSPGNILFEKKSTDYRFALVDINRMRFGKISEDKQYKVFRRLSTDENTLKIIAKEYAAISGQNEDDVTRKILFYTHRFIDKKARKKRWKKAFRKKS